jgi:hypothetical protein
MVGTLYSQMKNIEGMVTDLVNLGSSIKNPEHSTSQMQEKIFTRYERNPVLCDAIQGKQSIEQSLDELAGINNGLAGKFFPRRKNKAHNDRLKDLGELIDEPKYLRESGILAPDNFVSVTALVAAGVFGFCYLMSEISSFPSRINDLNPEQLKQALYAQRVLIPAAISVVLAPGLGALATAIRFKKLPIDQARYLDGKVNEFYNGD